MELKRNHIFIILAILTIVGAIIRFSHISFNSLWLDEIATYMYSQGSLQDIWNYMIKGEYNPPMFYWVENIVMRFLGASEFSLRLVSAIASTATIPVIYYLGKEIHNDTTGLIAAVLCAFSPWMIVYSQEARAYACVVFLCTLALYLLVRAIRYNKSPASFVVTLAIAFWMHFYAIFFAIPLIAKYISKRGFRLSLLLYPAIIAPAAYGMARLVGPRLSVGSNFGFVGVDLITQSIYQFAGFSIAAGIMFIGLVGLGFYQLYKYYKMKCETDPTQPIPSQNIIYWFAFIILFVYAVSFVLSYYITIVPRYFAFILPVFYVVIGASMEIFQVEVKTKTGIKKTKIISYLILIMYFVLIIPSYFSIYTLPIKPDLRSTAEYMTEHIQPGQSYLYADSYIIPLQFYYNNVTHGTFEYKMIDTRGVQSVGAGPWAPYPGPPSGGQDHGQDWKSIKADYYIIPLIDVSYSKDADDTIMWFQNNTVLVQKYNFMEIRVPINR